MSLRAEFSFPWLLKSAAQTPHGELLPYFLLVIVHMRFLRMKYQSKKKYQSKANNYLAEFFNKYR